MVVNWTEAKADFVEKGHDTLTVCSNHGCTRLELGRRMASENWRQLREDFIVKSVDTITNKLGTEGHDIAADELVALGRSISKELHETKPEEKSKLSGIRAKAEAFRTTVEALDRAVRLARDSRGLRLGQPSRPQSTDSGTTIEYFTTVRNGSTGEEEIVESAEGNA
jgi:hypothetical protein